MPEGNPRPTDSSEDPVRNPSEGLSDGTNPSLRPVHREFFDATSDALFIHSEDGRILDVNQQACSMFECDREALLSLSLDELSLGTPPYSLAEAKEKVRLAIQEGVQIFPWRSKRLNGDLFWSEVALRAFNVDGKVRVIASVRDITERKEAEEHLNHKNEMLLALNAYSLELAAIPFTANIFASITGKLKELTGARGVAVSVYDPSTATLTVKHSTLSGEESKRLTRFLGRRLEGSQFKVSPEMYERITTEVIGDAGTLNETTFGGITPIVGNLVEKAFGIGWFTGMALLHEGRLIGTVVMAGKAGTNRPEDEELKAFSGVTTNALRRWLSEQSSFLYEAQARQEQDLTERLLDSLPGIFFLYDADLRLRRWNRTHEVAMGFSPDELWGRQLGDWFASEEDRQTAIDKAREVFQNGGPLQMELPLLLEDGRSVPYVFTIVRLDSSDEPMMMGVGTDMSERAHLQDQLQQAMKMEAIGRLAGGVAHDFNNLLTVISGHVELAARGLRSSDPLAHHIDEIAAATASATSLTRQLLAFSRRQIIEPKILSLNELVQTLETMLGRLIGEDIEFRTVLSEGLASVKVDPGQIDLLITDVVMPGMNGRELAERLTKLEPKMKVLFTSGYTEDVILHHGVIEEELNFIGKPYALGGLGAKIRDVLA